jgi:uncharacterized protein involved in cysteine biosynthesis
MPIVQVRPWLRNAVPAWLEAWSWVAFLIVALAIADVSTTFLSQYSANVGSIWLANGVVAATVMRSPTERWLHILGISFAVLVAGDWA